jgi:hypothetical protein
MLQPRELRIGNLVIWNPQLLNPKATLPPMYIEVFEIMQDKIAYVFPNIENRVEPFEDDVVQRGTHTRQFEELDPVILTREILPHAGFTENKELLGSTYFIKNNIILKPVDKGFKFHDHIEVSFRYLHQLQNFYYLVTGEDLDIDHFWS